MTTYSIIELETFTEVASVRTPEEACDLLHKWQLYKPESTFETLEKEE